MITWQEAVPVVAGVALGTWLVVGILVAHLVKRGRRVPRIVTEAAYVSVYAACAGGLFASLGFTGALDSTTSAILAVAWRTTVLVCGLYAATAATRAAVGPRH